MFTALIGCFRRDRSLVWFVEPDELFKSSVVEIQLEGGGGWTGEVERGGDGSRSSRDPMTWVRHVTVAQERKSIHERMRSTGVDYRLGPWLLEGWREMGGV